MKKFLSFTIFVALSLSLFFSVGCSDINQQNMARDLATSVSNLSTSLANLDWPEEEKIETLEESTRFERDDPYAIDDIQTNYDTDIDTTEIDKWIRTLKHKINILNSKKDEINYYINQINNGNAALDESNLNTIKVYINIVKDNSNYLSSYNGLITTQIDQAVSIIDSQNNLNLINAYIIKSIETLQIRSAKLDTSILALNSICDIISKHLNHKLNKNIFIFDNSTDKNPQPDNVIKEDDNQEENAKEEINNDTPTDNQEIDNNIEINNQIEIESNQVPSDIIPDDVVEVENVEPEKAEETIIIEKPGVENQDNLDENISQIDNNSKKEKEPLIEDSFEENSQNIQETSTNEKPITREIYKEKIV